ncbi:MAG: hypothetical protein AAGD14_02110 [Planctomycetota bacterium]
MHRICTLLLPLALAACSSAREQTRENHHEVSIEMADRLVVQLRERTDLRRLKVTVRSFDDRTGSDRTYTKRNRVYFAKPETPREFRQELIEALAPQLRVVDSTAKVQQAPPTDSDGWGPVTREAMLVGEYTADEDETVYLRTRVIDAESKIVLATAEGIVRK